MTIHVLFAPVQGVEGDIPLLPSTIIPVKLDDEAQFRCAEYIQTEIERYAEELEESTTATEGNQDSSELSDPSEEETQKTKKSKEKATDATPKNNGTSQPP
jgi:cohesin complex subunit SA-1/2